MPLLPIGQPLTCDKCFEAKPRTKHECDRDHPFVMGRPVPGRQCECLVCYPHVFVEYTEKDEQE